MASEGEPGRFRKRQKLERPRETGPYIVRPFLSKSQLPAGDEDGSIKISCLELWGTAAAEILHYVSIPVDPSGQDSEHQFILASRLQPPSGSPAGSNHQQPGVQQILVLPRSRKACMLCNGTLTFYTLPELSPAYGNTKVKNCSGVGGADLNIDGGDPSSIDSDMIMLSLKDRIQLVRIGDGEKPKVLKNIEYPGSVAFSRRGSIACVANAHSYALLDVHQQQKIPLFPISSLDRGAAEAVGGRTEDIAITSESVSSRPASSVFSRSPERSGVDRGHGRSTSLGGLMSGLGRRQESPRPPTQDSSPARSPARAAPERSPPRSAMAAEAAVADEGFGRQTAPADKPLPLPPISDESTGNAAPPGPPPTLLRPHILSSTPHEFLLTTGTADTEAGMGMFVNLEGDVVRGTIDFDAYPQSLVLDSSGIGNTPSIPHEEGTESYVLGVMHRRTLTGDGIGIEIQRWDAGASERSGHKHWVDLRSVLPYREGEASPTGASIRTASTAARLSIPEIGKILKLQRLRFPSRSSDRRASTSTEAIADSSTITDEAQSMRENEEERFSRRLIAAQAQIILSSDDQMSWVIRNPLTLQLDAMLEEALGATNNPKGSLDRRKVVQVFGLLGGHEARTEAEFLGQAYIRQKASLILFTNVLEVARNSNQISPNHDGKSVAEALLEGGLDPRVVLALLPAFRPDIKEGPQGIWVHAGIKTLVEDLLQGWTTADRGQATSIDAMDGNVVALLRIFLSGWRRKKGFGSIADEVEVFQTVDAALLRVLLELDKRSPPGRATTASIRKELYGFIDQGLDCFDQAVMMLNDASRLYVLSRLYQSRRMSADVLSTWRRILEGAPDGGGEFVDGEVLMRRYLTNIRDPALIEEYGAWLAARNPSLGVQIFADDQSRVQFGAEEVVQILKDRAPKAVKEYLEYLVFGKKNAKYANHLISYYLDSVLTELETSEAARIMLSQSYETYRALSRPRPTYRQFILDNAVDEEWWRNRLRLLQLLGGSHGAASAYDVPAVLRRVESHELELVPEMIILNGRQERHDQALRLLTHKLRDYDTAIKYCVFGVASIFRSGSGGLEQDMTPSYETQTELFGHLLSEFLQIEDVGERIEQTSGLLEHFGGWYDIQEVLALIPDTWSVELMSGFLISALRQMVHERSDSMISKALSGAENLSISAEFIARCEELGPRVEAAR
ncbi:MAG: hypothetical protein M1817_000991 [Caeruleum heppii]|nr:MAG: hypothetical protein M1817_000991 [Caeruleum heppii]